HCSKMRMIMGSHPAFLGPLHNLVQSFRQAAIIFVRRRNCSFRTTTYNQVLRAEFGSKIRSFADSPQFFRQNLREDKVATAVDGQQIQSGISQLIAKLSHPSFIVQEVAIEE